MYKNEELDALYKYALEKNKTIIIVSDIYLPFDVMTNILMKNGYDKYHKLYLSSELKKTKMHGSLYTVILEDLKVDGTQILHIGDNDISDVMIAQNYGLDAFLYPKVISRFFAKDNRYQPLYNSISELSIKTDISALIMLSAVFCQKESNASFWERFGFEYAGSMVYSFTKWILDNAKNEEINSIGFVARDGYFLNKIAKILTPEINAQYIYASRKVIDSVTSSNELMDVYKQDLGSKLSGNIAFVDVRTNNFTSQDFISKIYPDSKWFYWAVGMNRDRSNFKCFYDYTFENDEEFLLSDIIEFFMSASEPPLKGLIFNNNQLLPDYMDDLPKEELYRINVIKEMEFGILKFAQNVVDIFGQIPILQNPHSIIIWNNLWLLNTSDEESIELSKIYHSQSQNHDKYISLLELKNDMLYQMYVKALKHFRKQV